MTDITVTSLPRDGADQYPAFGLAAYGQEPFSMYSGPDHFTTQIPLALSPRLLGWLSGLGTGVAPVAPPQAVQTYRHRLQLIQMQYL